MFTVMEERKMEGKGVVIAMGSRDENLAASIETACVKKGYRVYRSEANTQAQVEAFYKTLEEQGIFAEQCIYIPLPLKEVSLFDADFLDCMSQEIDGGLVNGTWWIQQSCSYFKRNGYAGTVTVLNHIPSVVPDMKYSYCCIQEAALGNLVRVAAMDTYGNTDVRINMVTFGWRETDAGEKAWFEEMQEIYGGAKAPILKLVSNEEVADTCTAAASLSGMNGANLFVDGGYSVSRTIRARI